jgi:hypothetical protein
MQPEQPIEEAPAEPVYCRHCGAELANRSLAEQTDDWLCPSCEHYQDSTQCPTCGGNTRISLLPNDLRPAAHKPVKAKE